MDAEARRRGIDGLLLGILFAGGAAATWRCWNDVIVDFGHELYVPWRLTQGDALGRDIFLVTGPASQLYHAALFALFGPSLTTLIFSNLVLLAILVGLIYDELGAHAPRSVAVAGAAFFLLVFAFAQNSRIANYNFVCPYRHELTHGFVAGMTALVALRRGARSKRGVWTLIAGAACGLSLVLKPETCVATWGAVVAWHLFHRDVLRADQPKDNTVPVGPEGWRRRTALFLGGALIPPAACFAALSARLSAAEAFDTTFAAWRFALRTDLARSPFYQSLSGFDQPLASLLSLAITLLVGGLGVVLALLADVVSRSLFARRGPQILVGAASFLVGLYGVSDEGWTMTAAALPFVALLVAAACAWRRIRGPLDDDERWLGVWALFAFLLSLKTLLRSSWSHYGFVLSVPCFLLAVRLSLVEAPRFARQLRGSGGFARSVAAGLLTAFAVGHAAATVSIDRLKTAWIGEGGDRFRVDVTIDQRAVVVDKTLRHLKARQTKDDTLLVIHDGAMLNWLLRMRNPTPYTLLSPWDIAAAGGEETVLQAVVRSPPDWIVLINDDMTAHGTGPFGAADYGPKIGGWIVENYHSDVAFFGPPIPGGQPYVMHVWRRATR